MRKWFERLKFGWLCRKYGVCPEHRILLDSREVWTHNLPWTEYFCEVCEALDSVAYYAKQTAYENKRKKIARLETP